MNKKTDLAMPLADDTEAAKALVATIAAKPADTIDYDITLGTKTLELRNVPIKDNKAQLQASIISMYSGLGAGEYKVDGTSITVTVKDN